MFSIIIINYNTFQLTCQCIQSVIDHTRHTPYEIILVDNASTECNPDLFKQRFKDIILVKSEKNLGFAGGNNLGIRHARGNHILLLNSDAYFIEDSIAICTNVLCQQKNIGVLGCRMVYPDGRLQHTARRFRTISWELLDLFRLIPYLLPYKRRAILMLGKYFRGDFNTDCDWVNGAYFLIPSHVLLQLPDGKLDDRFFMYAEDHLWCEQIKNLGYRIFFTADTTIVHINSGSTNIKKQLGLRKVMIKNELTIVQLRKGKGLYYYCFALIFLLKQYLLYAVKWVKQKI